MPPVAVDERHGATTRNGRVANRTGTFVKVSTGASQLQRPQFTERLQNGELQYRPSRRPRPPADHPEAVGAGEARRRRTNLLPRK